MKKQLFLALILIFAIGMVFAGTPRIYIQRCSLDTGGEAPVTNGATATSPDYIIRATNMATMEVLGTDLGTPATSIRISRVGNGTSVPYYTAVALQLGTFPTQWVAGNVIHMYVQYIPTLETAEWDMTIPAGSTTINIQDPIQVIPPYTAQSDTYNLYVNTLPTQGYDILKDASPTGQVSDHMFTAETADALIGTYTMAPVAGFHWEPAEYVVTAGMFAKATYETTIEFVLVEDPPPPDNYTLNVTGPDGYAIIKNTVDTGQVTDYAFMALGNADALVGTYTLGMAPMGFHWEPAEYVVVEGDFTLAKADYSYAIDFQLVADPDTYTYNLYVTGPDGYAVTGPVDGVTDYMATDDMVDDLVGEYTIAAAPVGFEWAVNPIVVAAGDFVLQTKADYVYNATIEFVLEELPMEVVPVDPTTVPPGYPEPEGFEVAAAYFVTWYGIHDLYIPRNPGEAFAYAYVGGAWIVPNGTPDWTWLAVNFDAKGYIPVIVLEAGEYELLVEAHDLLFPAPNPDLNAEIWWYAIGDDPINATWTGVYTPYTFGAVGNLTWQEGTYSVRKVGYASWLPESITFDPITTDYAVDFLGIPEDQTPVELSSFTATLTAETYVQLTWVSQTETQMMGYLVYRNSSNDQSTATLIDHPMIPATNSSSTQSYTVIDNDVNIGTTYYYWLEAVDFNSSSYHGPVSVTVEGNVPPVLPEVTSMRNAYPNPFKANSNTTIEVAVKAGENGTITIYNVLGQVVKTVSVTEGTHSINWNGKDNKGNVCGSGIYFYKLSTPSINVTKKMVIVK